MTADAGYDSEENQRIGRDDMGVATLIPPALSGVEGVGRPSKNAPAGHYRRMTKELFNAEVRDGTFGQRCPSTSLRRSRR